MVYDDYSDPPLTPFPWFSTHKRGGGALITVNNNDGNGGQRSLIPHVEANFEDRTQTNYSNAVVGKNNKNGLAGFLLNNPIPASVFTRIDRNSSVGIQDSIFAPARIGALLPPRSQKGRYQYVNAAPYKAINHIVDPEGAEVTRFASPISSSAYSYNSEIKFNPYVAYYSVSAPESQTANVGAPGSESSVVSSRTDVSFTRNATVRAFSAYDKLFGDSNYSSTAEDLEDIDATSGTTTPAPTQGGGY